MFKEYFEYTRDNPRGLWFKERWYGWGWVPATWQGWSVVGVFIAVVVLNSMLLEANAVSNGIATAHDLAVFFEVLLVSVLLLLWICIRKGERPHWNWGDPRKK